MTYLAFCIYSLLHFSVYIGVLKDGGDIITFCSPAGVSQPYHLHLLHLCHICFHDSAWVNVTVNVLRALKLHHFTNQLQPDADCLHEFIIDYSYSAHLYCGVRMDSSEVVSCSLWVSSRMRSITTKARQTGSFTLLILKQ